MFHTSLYETKMFHEFETKNLKAINNNEEKLTSQNILASYQLGSSGNVKRIREALENKEIIDFIGVKPEFNDPSFSIWLNRYYFN